MRPALAFAMSVVLAVLAWSGRAWAEPPGLQLAPPTTAQTPGTSPSPTPAPDEPSGEGGGGLFDVGEVVSDAVVGFLSDVGESFLDPSLSLLGQTILSTPDLASLPRMHDLWVASAVVANGAFVLLTMVGAAAVMGHGTVQVRLAAKDLAARLVLAVVAANASLAVVSQTTVAANALSSALLGGGAGAASASEELRRSVVSRGGGSVALVILGLVVAALAIGVLGGYIVRVALVAVLIVGGPLALATHLIPGADGLARMWWRALAGCAAMQIAQSLVLLAAVRVVFAPGGRDALGLGGASALIDALVAACLLWVCVRIPVWVGRVVLGPGRHSGALRSATRTIAVRAGRAAAAAA